ncbi:MAG: site-2 protease family protein [Alphaproteobacteria bacterium]|nr:site-2 protease family protein [Alphaproteobacteria bacterium]
MDFSHIIYEATTWVFPLLFVIVFHEVAHGFVAYQFGDTTAQRAGRLTLNPIHHIDIYGTIIIPIVLLVMNAPIMIGWAKPVPVNFNALTNPKRDMGIVALAGPVTNFILAILFAVIGKFLLMILPPELALSQWISDTVHNGIGLSLVIGIFNLFPLLPLDGGRILAAILPDKYSLKYQKTEPYGFLILMGILFLLPAHINPILWFIRILFPYFDRMIQIFL